ncbi:hypothetical protein BBK14_24365 [Parafrankia soli]|uniref:Uncharacterized protein n=1 Tax=Parafrankia soli TaxID=2599596 RepID=A0A1S1PPX9_9ACTN|nr:hypothetical protein [Parafrankia soli]OHV23259.1 hypothetical protein BBK14_24365 [Parafrankia soli]
MVTTPATPPPPQGLNAAGRAHQAQHPGHCAYCGHNDHGPLAADDGSAVCAPCRKRIRANRRANRQIDANLAAGRARPYDVPNSPYRACRACGTRGPLRTTSRGDVCAAGCTPAGR